LKRPAARPDNRGFIPTGAPAVRALPTLLLPIVLLQSTLLLAAGPAHAATLRVGPGETITRISEAARLAQDGDVVEILPGEYRGDVAVWTQKRLTIRGPATRPVLLADGRSAEDKAIWVIRGGDFLIDNIEFRGARVADGNGAGIRFERGRLTVKNSAFRDNQTGILTANFADAELRIEDSLFAEAPRQQHSLPHLLYVGRIARLEVVGSRFERGYRGHLLKSRARRNELRYNLLYDGTGGEASYEIDLPNAGQATIVGNVVGQSGATQNPVMIAYGAEGEPWPDSRLELAHNTLISEGLQTAWFVRVWRERIPPATPVVTRNNLSVGLGAFTLLIDGDHRGNIALPPGALAGAARLDFGLDGDCWLRRLARVADLPALIPTAEFSLPVGTRPLAPPAAWAPGAFQSPPPLAADPP
jgi:hypothetical protein